MPGSEERPRVLIAGGGVAALEAALTLDEVAAGRFAVTLLSARSRFEYVPLSVGEPFGLGRAHRFELDEVLSPRQAEIAIDSLEAVNAERGEAHTGSGLTLSYDALLIAIGARKQSSLPGAVVFTGARGAAEVRRLLREAEEGKIASIVFVVPSGVSWSLPAYELALMAGAHFAELGLPVSVSLVTPEQRPIEVFGEQASSTVGNLLRNREINFHRGRALRAEPGKLLIEDGDPISADAVVVLPQLEAPEITGVPRDAEGFVSVDSHGRVRGLDQVYAAGDVTDFPYKQGGLAAQQAETAAMAIASDLGEAVEPQPFNPELRGLLLTGRAPRYLRAEVSRGGEPGPVDGEPEAWSPPEKIAADRLGPLLALLGAPGTAPPGSVALELVAPDLSDDQCLGR